MFESGQRIREEIHTLLDVLRDIAHGRYACVMEPGAILFEAPEAEGNEIMTLRRLLELHAPAIFALPAAMEAEGPGPEADPFEGWDHDELLLVFINGRVAVAIACPQAEANREALMKPLRALIDRLFRYKESYRLDAAGRGLFFGRPKVDFVTIAHQS
jgi:hypothetical protein